MVIDELPSVDQRPHERVEAHLTRRFARDQTLQLLAFGVGWVARRCDQVQLFDDLVVARAVREKPIESTAVAHESRERRSDEAM